MAGDIKGKYGTNNQAITITLNSLAASATVGRASTAVDNTTNLYVDALVTVTSRCATGTPSNNKGVWVYAYATVDGGTNYTDGATGSDAGFTRTDPPNMPLLGFVNTPAAGALTYKGGPWSVAAAFGGTLPDHWGIACFNDTGLTLNAATNSAAYQGVLAQYT